MTAWVKSFAGSMVMSAMLIALTAPAASAQVSIPPDANPAQSVFLGTAFATAVNGKELWITTANGSRQKARVTAVAPTGLTVSGTGGQGQTLLFGDITRIQKVKHRLRTGTLAGLAVGAGLGALGIAACDGEASCATGFLVSYAAIGAGVGALAGAIRNHANRTDDIVFEAGPRTTTVAFAPVLSRTTKGAALTLTWR
jgi:hypothetical protein